MVIFLFIFYRVCKRVFKGWCPDLLITRLVFDVSRSVYIFILKVYYDTEK